MLEPTLCNTHLAAMFEAMDLEVGLARREGCTAQAQQITRPCRGQELCRLQAKQ